MKSRIRKIGNRKGIILPQSFLNECDIEDAINIEIKDNCIIISAADTLKREGWENAFKEMAANGDDRLVIPDLFKDEDFTDWTSKS